MIMRWTNMKCIENYPLYTDPTARRSSYTYPTGTFPNDLAPHHISRTNKKLTRPHGSNLSASG